MPEVAAGLYGPMTFLTNVISRFLASLQLGRDVCASMGCYVVPPDERVRLLYVQR